MAREEEGYFKFPQASAFGGWENPMEADDDFGLIGKFVGGFVEGFSTIPVNDEPENTWEALAENLGHLLGFIGIVPGLGTVGSMGAKAIMGTGRFAARAAMKTVGSVAGARTTIRAGHRIMSRASNVAAPVARFKSVPMWVADKVTKKTLESNASGCLHEVEVSGSVIS